MNYCRYNERRWEKLDLLQKDKSKAKATIHGLVDWLFENKELKKRYSLSCANCDQFARGVFAFVAKDKVIDERA